MKKNIQKSSKGITLIALVITIIVLLILAGVTISQLTGSDSAPAKANEASQKNAIGSLKDEISIFAQNKQMEAYEKVYVDNASTTKAGDAKGTVGKYVIDEVYKEYDGKTKFGVTASVTKNGTSDATIELTTTDWKQPGTIEYEGGVLTWGNLVAITGSETNQGNAGNEPGDEPGDNPGDTPGENPSENPGDTPVVSGTITITDDTSDTIRYATLASNKNFGDLKTDTSNFPCTSKNTVVTKGNQQIVIPAGFKVVAGNAIEDGMVIKDASEEDGNEFVWVPVNQPVTYSSAYNSNTTLKTQQNEASATSGTITLSRYYFGTSSSPTITKNSGTDIISSYFTENATSFTASDNKTHQASVARNLTDFINKTNASKGYYIGRYEMGIEGATVNIHTKQWTETSTESKKVVCKSGKTVYNYRTRDEAKAEAQGLYNNIQKGTETIYTSDLVNSYAWDTAIVFIEKCGANSNYAFRSRLRVNSSEDPGPYATGASRDSQCNINDMAGNVCEWTTEYSNYADSSRAYPCVRRGGSYDETNTTRSRGSNTTSSSSPRLGFRPLLYL